MEKVVKVSGKYIKQHVHFEVTIMHFYGAIFSCLPSTPELLSVGPEDVRTCLPDIQSCSALGVFT